jgi:sugar lactone lactonase YvrE
MLPKSSRSFAWSVRNSKRKPKARRILGFERLEERSLLTAVPTLTALTTSASTVTAVQSVTLTATVTVAAPNTGTPTGGTVTFFNGSTSLGTATLNSGEATLQIATLPVGTDVLTANYGGGGSFAGSSTAIGPNSIITTIAGSGTTYNGDGIPATAAELLPLAVAVDNAGDLFIADVLNNRIREVNHATGVITTVAGNGTPGYSGDGGPATLAQLQFPMGGIAVDPAGDLFIADTSNNVVREVNHATGVINTVAGTGTEGFSGDGGPATLAELKGLMGIAVDSAGDLFISADNRVREVKNGVINTVAGNGTYGYSGDGGSATAAGLSSTAGIAVDSAGDLFIADTDHNVIREVKNGVINTVAGNGDLNYSGDGGQATAAGLGPAFGVAVDTAGDLFISVSNRVREVKNGVINTVAGNGTYGYSGDGGLATTAELSSTAGIAVDTAGGLFIVDAYNGRIREVKNGLINTVAGNGPLEYSGDGGQATAAGLGPADGIAVDSAGDIFIADIGNRIREVNHATGVITTVAGTGIVGYSGDGGPATAAELDEPTSIAVDTAGDIFIADGCRVREVNHATGVITTIAGTGIVGYSGNGGPATAAELGMLSGQGYGIAVDSTGDVFIADNDRVREVNHTTHIITTVAGNGSESYSGDGGQATAAGLDEPGGLAVDSTGDLFIAEQDGNRIREVNLSTGIITTVAGNGTQGYSGDGGQATGAKLDSGGGIAVDAAGDLFITDDDRIREVNLSTGIITTVAGNGSAGYSSDNGPAIGAELCSSSGVAVDAAGDLFIADIGNVRIREVANGITVTVAGDFPIPIPGPTPEPIGTPLINSPVIEGPTQSEAPATAAVTKAVRLVPYEASATWNGSWGESSRPPVDTEQAMQPGEATFPLTPAGDARGGGGGSAAQMALLLALGEITAPPVNTFDAGDLPPEVLQCAAEVPEAVALCARPTIPKEEPSVQDTEKAANWSWGVPAAELSGVAALAGSLGMYAWHRMRDKQRKRVLDEIIFVRIASDQPDGNGELPLSSAERRQGPSHRHVAEIVAAEEFYETLVREDFRLTPVGDRPGRLPPEEGGIR